MMKRAGGKAQRLAKTLSLIYELMKNFKLSKRR